MPSLLARGKKDPKQVRNPSCSRQHRTTALLHVVLALAVLPHPAQARSSSAAKRSQARLSMLTVLSCAAASYVSHVAVLC